MLQKSSRKRNLLRLLWIGLIFLKSPAQAEYSSEELLLRQASMRRLLSCRIQMPATDRRGTAWVEANCIGDTLLHFETEPRTALLLAQTIHILTGQQIVLETASREENLAAGLLAAWTCLMGFLGCILAFRYRRASKQPIDVEPIDRTDLSQNRWPYLTSGHLASDLGMLLAAMGLVGLLTFFMHLYPMTPWLASGVSHALLFAGIVAHPLFLWGLFKMPRWGVVGGGVLWQSARFVWILWCCLSLLGAVAFLTAHRQPTIPIAEQIHQGPEPPVLMVKAIQRQIRDVSHADWHGLAPDRLLIVPLGKRVSGTLVDGTRFEHMMDLHATQLLLDLLRKSPTRIHHTGIEKDSVSLEALSLRVPSLYLYCILPVGGLFLTGIALFLTRYPFLVFPGIAFALQALPGLLLYAPILSPMEDLPVHPDLLWPPLSTLCYLGFLVTMPKPNRALPPVGSSRTVSRTK